MSQVPSNPDVVIIGAGAAGIGAGIGLLRHGVSFAIIEAKQRIGGRAYSETSSLGHLWDQGCHWFHTADRNVLRSIADRLGHGYRKEPYGGGFKAFQDGRWEDVSIRDAYVWTMLDYIAAEGAKADVSAESLLDRSHPGYSSIRHWCQLMQSHDPENISAKDVSSYLDTHINLAVRDGYGALVARLATGLPIRLDTAARRVAVTGSGVEVETDAGTLRAAACIVAVPARMMERERIAFAPGLPPAVQDAFSNVPMGHCEKVAVAFDAPVLSELGVGYADVLEDKAAGLPPFNIEVHPFGRPIIVAHMGGSAVAEMTPEDRLDLFGRVVTRAFGADVSRRITHRTTTSWTADPFINGAYSCAKPGKAHLRAVFDEPVHDRVFLAGEHVHRYFHATAHGAYETGLAAAARAARLLGRPVLADEPEWLPPNHL